MYLFTIYTFTIYNLIPYTNYSLQTINYLLKTIFCGFQKYKRFAVFSSEMFQQIVDNFDYFLFRKNYYF